MSMSISRKSSPSFGTASDSREPDQELLLLELLDEALVASMAEATEDDDGSFPNKNF